MADRMIEDFIQYANVTDQTVMSGPEAFVNDSTLFLAHTWAQAWALKKEVQTAAEIKDWIILSYEDHTELVGANHKFEPKPNSQQVKYSIGWGILANHNMWDDDEMDFNAADKRAMYKDLYKTYVIPMHTSSADKVETLTWDTPHDNMENPPVGQVRRPYSIPALITKTGLQAAGFATATTKFGINPTTQPRWRNHFEQFTNYQAEIEKLLRRAKRKTTFLAPAGPAGKVFTGTPQDRKVIYADARSVEELALILRNSNDRLTKFGEYDWGLTYLNTPFVVAEVLGDETIDPTAQRLFGVNYDFLFPICHGNKFMKLMDPPYGGTWKPYDMPKSNVIYEFSYFNWWPRSLRRQFVISHSGGAAW